MDQRIKMLFLGRGHVTIVNLHTFRLLKLDRFEWRAQVHKRARKVYAVANPGRYLHRMLIGAQRGQIVDHIDGNSLNNRADNLRIVTPSQNRANSRKDRDNRSGYKGVYFEKSCRRWVAQIAHQGRKYYLGVFREKRRAAMAHDRAAIAIHGQHAGLNFPGMSLRPRDPR